MNPLRTKRKILLGQLLIEKDIISAEQLQLALEHQKQEGELLGNALISLGFVENEDILLPAIAEQRGINYIRLKHFNINEEVIEMITAKIALRYKAFPVSLQNGILTVAMVRPYDVLLVDEISMLVNEEINPVLASVRDIAEAIGKYYGIGIETIEEIMDHKFNESKEKVEVLDEIQNLEEESDHSTIIDFLNQIFLDAYKKRATDIHIEPYENELIVRYRIDGALCEISVPKGIEQFKAAIASRIKIMSNLDIAERRLPQDGRCRVRVGDVELDLRVSFMPSRYGESCVIRMLNSSQLFTFNELNLAEEEGKILKTLITKPHGIVFMTGPTGSGKTTTLYSCLSQINTVDRKIITLEDPVEYQLKGVVQIQVNPAINFTFARGLRSVLRHDPDVIMVGEVRDTETAEIAIQVALTGHLIFSTLHTNDAAGGIARLLNMGIEPYLITSTVECFIAQRLVRVICPRCKEEKEISSEVLNEFKKEVSENDDRHIAYEGKGCKECSFTGFKGRASIFEFLVLHEELCEMILKRESAMDIKRKAMKLGMKTLRQSGWEKVKAGITTPAEILRVTQERSSHL